MGCRVKLKVEMVNQVETWVIGTWGLRVLDFGIIKGRFSEDNIGLEG